MKITICAFDTPNNLDGPTTWIKRLLPYLKEKNIETRIIFLAANSKDLPAYNYFVKEGFDCKLVYWELFNDEKVIAILNDVKEHTPDIFIANYFAIAFEAAKFIKKAGIPTVMVLHNDNKYHYDLVKKYAANNDNTDVSAVVCVSDLIHQISVQTAPEHKCIRYIAIGAPVTDDIAEMNVDDDVLKVVYAGRIEEKQKRISDVTKAFCKAAKQVPGTIFTMYGHGDAIPAVEKIIATEGKGLLVSFKGKLKSTEVQAHFVQNHVYVLLSEFEGLPIALMEAMSCGLVPICTYMRSGIGELITDQKEGFLIKDRNEEFVAVIKKIKEDRDLWKRMSQNARQKIIDSYSVETCSDQWVSLLHELLSTAGNKLPLLIPPVSEIRKIRLDAEFSNHNNQRPAPVLVLVYRLKFFIGRFIRKLNRGK